MTAKLIILPESSQKLQVELLYIPFRIMVNPAILNLIFWIFGPEIFLVYCLKHKNNKNKSYEKANETEYVFKINFNRIPFYPKVHDNNCNR